VSKLKILQLFMAIAFVAVLLLPCYTIFIVTPLYTNFIVQETEKVVEGIAWQLALHLVDVPDVSRDKLPQDFIREVEETKKLVGLWKIKLYEPEGIISYSTDLSEIGGKTTKDFFQGIISTGETHTLINKKEIITPSGNLLKIDLVETYVPITREGKTIGVFEIYYNISESKKDLSLLTARSGLTTYLIASILAVLIIVLSFKASGSIHKQEQAEKKLKLYSGRLETLRKIDEAILAIQAPESIAKIAIDHVKRFIPYNSISVFSYDFDEKTKLLLAAEPLSKENDTDTGNIDNLAGLDKMMEGEVFTEISERYPSCRIKVPLMTGDFLVGSIDIQCEAAIKVDEEDFLIVKEISGALAIAIQNARLFESVDAQRHQLRVLSFRLSNLEESERRKIAIELHDRVGQNLTALNLNLNIIKSRIRAGEIAEAEPCIADSFRLIEETTEEIRDIMSELRPFNLDDHGVLAAIRWYASQLNMRTGLEIEVSGDESASRLPVDVEMVLFRIAQEALTNVVKHAKAHSAMVRIEQRKQTTIMTIMDDGIGFDLKSNMNMQMEFSGLGIIAMRERVSALGGTLKVKSAPGEGTTVFVEV